MLALAHGGCASVWLLVLEVPHRGEVWVDAAGSDRLARRVAPSFDAWYHRWLQAGVRDRPCWKQWDGGACAVPHLLSSALDARPPALQHLAPRDYFAAHPLRDTTLYARGNPYFDAHTAIDACQSCAIVADKLGVDPYVFTPGPALFGAALQAPHEVSSTQTDADDAPPPAPLWKRWLGLG